MTALVFALIVAAFLVAPLFVVVPMSFSTAPSFAFPPPGYWLGYYRAFFASEAWLGSVLNSLIIASATTVPWSRKPKVSPITVTVGMRALRRAWRFSTRRSGKPLARAGECAKAYSERHGDQARGDRELERRRQLVRAILRHRRGGDAGPAEGTA